MPVLGGCHFAELVGASHTYAMHLTEGKARTKR